VNRILSGQACATLIAIGLPASATVAQVAFSDLTASSGVQFVHKPSPQSIPMPQANMVGGIAVADYNNDGWPDIFWVSGGVTPDRLFINNGDGTFNDRAALWGVDAIHGGCGACAGDYDGDGWIDIYVTSFGTGTNGQGQVGKNRLYRNNGGTGFTDVAASAGVNFTSTTLPSGFGCTFGDYDLDGDLDLAATAWYAPAKGNRLYRNNGNGTFTDVTGTAIVFPPVTWGFQSRFADMDNDGWPDLLLSADFHTSRYYRNNGNGTFADLTATNGTGQDQNGMGQCVGDFNHTGRLDWYVTSIYLDNPQPLSGEGNKLYLNQGDNQFVEAAQFCGVDDGGWGWGTVAIDFDHDTWLDIAEINGRPLNAEHSNEQIYLWMNNTDGTFTEGALAAGMTFLGEGKSLSYLDYDRDGRMDLAMTFNDSLNKLYRNSTPAGNWLHVMFDTSANPRLAPNGLNSRVEVVIDGQTRIFEVDGGPNFLGTSEICAHFGVGRATSIDELRIRWPRGYVTTLTDVAVNQHLVIDAPALCDLDADGVVGGADLSMLLARFGNLGTSSDRKADFNNDGVVDGTDLGALLSSWTPR